MSMKTTRKELISNAVDIIAIVSAVLFVVFLTAGIIIKDCGYQELSTIFCGVAMFFIIVLLLCLGYVIN